MINHITPPCHYRVSVKALIFEGEKILLCKEEGGYWDLPGGGLDHGEDFETGVRREIKEEMGLEIKSVAGTPLWAWPMENDWKPESSMQKILILGFVTKVENLDFTPSDECVEIGFFDKNEIKKLNLHPQIRPLVNFLEKHF